MLDTILSVVSAFSSTVATAKKGYDAYKQVCAIVKKSENRVDPLDRIATSFERLSERILYAPGLHAVEDVGRTQQQYVNDLREVREALDPVQRAVGTDILSSAMILTPEKMQQTLVKNPWDVLLDVRPVPLFSARLPPEGIPVLFELGGIQYLGWQLRGALPILFNCRYDELWLPSSVQRTTEPQTSSGQIFEFETVTVDFHGEVTHKEHKQAQQVKEDLGNGVILEMIYIPGGTFLMGSPVGEGNDDEKPQHSVTIQPFYMGKYPVTQAQWHAIMGNNPANFKGANRPVEMIYWEEAVEFCQKLSQRTGKSYQLPSEAQWEYACRAGTTTPFHFGEAITTDLVNYNGNYVYVNIPRGRYRQKTIPVGTFPPNAFGLYDMHGNVWEWCQDVWHDNYMDAPTDDSAWVTGGEQKYRLLRGGSWFNKARFCRSACRDRYDDRDVNNGFRLSSFSLGFL